jgi:type II secretory pathway component GspD/PulD (secretin)
VRNALRRAQDCYRKGDYEAACTYFQQAQAGQDELTAGEQQDLRTWSQLNSTAMQARREGASQLQQVDVAIRSGRTQDAIAILRVVSQNQQFLSPGDKQKIQLLNEQLMPRNSQSIQTVGGTADSTALGQARTMLRQARGLMARGNYDAAQALAREAEQKGATFGPREDTPQKLLAEIAAARSSRAIPDDPKSLLAAARESLSQGDFAAAEQLAHEAEKKPKGVWESVTSPFRGGDTPEKVLKDVRAARAKQARQGPRQGSRTSSEVTTNSAPAEVMKTKSQDPRMLLKQARELYNSQNLDEAEKLARRADAGKSRNWGLFEDSPEKLLVEIHKAKTKRDQEQSVHVMAEARKQFELRNWQEAKRLTYQAERLHPGSYNIWELGDRPQKLRAEIEVAENKERKNQIPPLPSGVAKKDSETPVSSAKSAPLPVIPAPVQAGSPNNTPTAAASTATNPYTPFANQNTAGSAKLHAEMLVAEARQLQRDGRLIEARKKALDAQRIGANFAPEEDRPEVALLQITNVCQQRIDRLVQQAGDWATTAASDPLRCQRAVADLTSARQLAVACGLDTQPIDSRLAALQPRGNAMGSNITTTQFSQMSQQDTPMPVGISPEQHGRSLLDQARRELRAGQTANARRLAETAFDVKYHVQAEAQQVIRSIDVEEFNQRMLVANHTFDAGIAAYNRREYSQAGTIMRSIDAKLLSPENQARLKEIMLVPEMQPGVVAQATLRAPASSTSMMNGDGSPGRAQATDFAPNRTMQPEPDFAAQVRAMHEVKFQKLREEGRTIQTEAVKRFQAGETDRALDLLRDYVASLGDSGLDAEKVALLRRPVEMRMQQLRTLKHQRDFEKLQASETEGAKERVVHGLMAEEEKKKQIAELMKQFNALYKEGKYKEAEMYAMRARELDPDDTVAGAAISMARMQEGHKKVAEAKGTRTKVFDEGLDDAENEGQYVENGKVAMDPEIWDKAKRRKPFAALGVTPAKSDKEREIYRKLDNPVNSMELKDTPLRQVLEDMQTWTGINIVPDEPALQEAGISLDHPVTMKLEGIACKSALNLLLHQVHLTYVVKDEVLNITTEDNARGKLVTRIHPVLDLVIPVENSSGTNVLKALGQNGGGDFSNVKLNNSAPFLGLNSMGGGQNASTGQIQNNIQANSGTPSVTIENPRGTLQDVLIKMVTNTIAPQSWASVGGPGTIDYYPLGMALVITQTPDIQEQVAELLQALRRLQDQEVAVEVRFITLAESFFERIGVDFNVNFKTNNTVYQPQLVSQQFAPFGFINSFNPSRFITGLTPAGTFTQDLNIPVNTSSFNMAVPPFGSFPNIPGGNGGIDLGLAFLSDIQVFLFMEAAQGDMRTNVMQAPKLTLFNGQTSTLTVTDEQFFVTAVTVVQAGGQVVFVPNNTIIPTGGVNLTLNAVISADRRFVRLSLAPQLTNLASANVPLFPITTFVTPIFEGGAVGQPIPFTQFLQQPALNIISVNTTVNVPDGGTVLMGGLKRLSEGRNEFGPPILSKLPWINRLFKNVGYGRQAESLLMMITPRIIINEEEEQRQVGGATAGATP